MKIVYISYVGFSLARSDFFLLFSKKTNIEYKKCDSSHSSTYIHRHKFCANCIVVSHPNLLNGQAKMQLTFSVVFALFSNKST